ncbi:MAG: ABC-F family ATP-binding cassette domain-containing protein [Candidatus Anammoxibacter sp.]
MGLVGRNGHGKTTLFNLITGQEEYDDGAIAIPKGYRIGYINQNIRFSKDTVLEECCCGLPEEQKQDDWKSKKVLSGLGFADSDFCRNPAEFSGGYQIRLKLAKVLVSEANLLLLDEPTNFLDIVTTRWLTTFLNSWRNEIIIISHDRSFMNNVTTHIMGIYRYKLKKITGSTVDYYNQIAKEDEVYEKERLNDEKKRKQTELFITRFRAKARLASLVQSRIKTLDKQKQKAKLETIKSLSFSFNTAPMSAKYVLEARNISFTYDNNQSPLFKNVDFTVEARDRICIVGKNGKGKTTLLKLLAEKLTPINGEISTHPQTRTGYFEQGNTANLNDDNTVEQEILSCSQYIDQKKARDICGKMMFSGDYALKKINVLSGGEKSRVLLGKLLLTPSNLLLLDEPTHHLDIESCDAMIDAVTAFEGAAVIVSHDEYLLHTIANKLIVFHEGKVFLFNGTYAQFLEDVGWGDENDILLKDRMTKGGKEPAKTASVNKKAQRKSRAEFISRRSKALEPLKKVIKGLEREIEEMECNLHEDTESLIVASQEQNVSNISRLSKSTKQIRTDIESLYNKLEEVNEKYELEKCTYEEEEKSAL